VAGAISDLKRQPGMDIVQYGFGAVTFLMDALKSGIIVLTYRNPTPL
jgi:hypothetical protein